MVWYKYNNKEQCGGAFSKRHALNIALAEKTTTLRHYEEDIQSLSLVLGDGGGPFGGGSSRSVIGAAVRVLSPRKSTIVLGSHAS